MITLTVAGLKKLFNQGDLNGLCKECRRYGKITADKSFDVDEGYYKGANRIFTIDYKGLEWRFEMLNGEVRAASYTKHEKQK